MKNILRLAALLLLLLVQFIAFAQSNAQKTVLVYFRTGAQRNPPPNQNSVTITSANIIQVLNTYGLSVNSVTSAFPDFNEADTIANEVIGEDSRQMNYAKVFAISLPDTSFKSSLINSLLNLSETLYAESDGDATVGLIPADPQFAQQWNMRNTIVPGADIHAEHAWDVFTGNPNSIIAIIDAGVDVNHNDLAPKINGGDNGFLIQNDIFVGDFSHGSHVAGIAAAVTNNNNNNGVASVDWQARIHSRFVIGNNGNDAGITRGLNNALNFNPNVWTFNNSWETLPHGRYSTTIRSAFANVYRNNRVSCIAMGNNHAGAPNTDDPPNFPVGINSGVIAVGATDINDGVAGFSNRGAHIDVSAPGVNILSTNFNNGYVVLSGTSMATPHVSGLASLLKGFNTALDNDDIEQIIRVTADDANAATNPGFDNQMGAGRINAERALQSLQAPNQLFHWTITGGNIVNTSGNQTRIFLGVPGFADGAYVVKRSEVRVNVVFPSAMCSMIGAWGRGVGTTGYREEQGRCFGEGICEIVPGTLTNNGATLRTWIYEVWGINGQYYGFRPRTANNVTFQYTVLGVPKPTAINGDNSFCSNISNNYTIPNLPQGAIVSWQANPQGIVTINSPNSPQTTLTKNTNGEITLTATISNTCGGQPFTLTKQIIVGAPAVQGYYVAQANGSVIKSAPILSNQLVSVSVPRSYTVQYSIELTSNLSSVTWNLYGIGNITSMTSTHLYWTMPASGSSPNNCTVVLNAISGSCPVSGVYPFQVIGLAGYGYTMVVSPNPATDNINVQVSQVADTSSTVNLIDAAIVKNNTPSLVTTNSTTVNNGSKINFYLCNLYSNAVVKQWQFQETKSDNYNLNISGVISGTYILKMEKNNKITTSKVIVQ